MSNMTKSGDQLYRSVELMKVKDNSYIWGNQYKRKISEIFAVQEEISSAIIYNLRLKKAMESFFIKLN